MVVTRSRQANVRLGTSSDSGKQDQHPADGVLFGEGDDGGQFS